MLDLHPSAVIAHNRTAESYMNLIKIIPHSRSVTQKFNPDFHPVAALTSSEVTMGPSWENDIFGNKTSIYLDEEERVGIFEEDYRQVQNFLRSLFKTKKVRNKISFKTLENIFQKWAMERFANKDQIDFISYLNQESSSLIKNQEIWVPIKFLSIEKEFNLGKVSFLPINKYTIDKIKYSSLDRLSSNSEKVKLEYFFENKIREVQGYTAGKILIESEFERACEIAVEEVQRSLSFLRLFSTAMYEPLLFYSGVIWGSLHIDHANIISLNDGAMNQFKMYRLDQPPRIEYLDSASIDQFFECGLHTLDQLLKTEKPNQFQDRLLNCLTLFSRSTIAKDSSDKLIYILTSLESFFLKTSSEPIQQNLGERIAFLIGQSPQERKEVVSLIRHIYDLRSKFIHHGIPIEDHDSLRRFMRVATDTVITLISYAYKFNTAQLLLNELEMRKFS